jgi:regulator of protease activity HflC (stomatin/prohibitin superfamily)
MTLFLGLIIFIAVFIAIILLKSVYLVRQAETVVIERLGRYSRTLGPGLHIVVPFIETPRNVYWTFVRYIDTPQGKRYQRFPTNIGRIDMRENVDDFPKQNVITKDNVTIEINALLYYQITDPRAAVYEINNLPDAIEKLTQTTLRDVIGSMDLDETLASRDMINQKLRVRLDEATDKWGVKVNRVELQEINPPRDIREAMEKQMRAERERREMILRSEGKKRSAILEAEGVKEARLLEAEGQANARLKVAEAEAKAVTMIKETVPSGDPLPYLLAMQYIQALPKMMEGKDDKMIVVPYEVSSFMGSFASIKEMFNHMNK